MDNAVLTDEDQAQLLCQHHNFTANVNVARLEDNGRFMAEITVRCEDCGTPFAFKGLPAGLDLNGATISPDGLEARLAIKPGIGGMFVPTD